MAPQLLLEGIESGYGHTRVVRGVTLEVGEGEVVALLGRNGAGKSTLLATIFGFIQRSKGDISVTGSRLKPGDPAAAVRSGLGLVPESRSLFAQLSVSDNLRVAGAKKADLDRAIERFPELGALMSRQAGLLSGGEQQMLAIARALVLQPKVLLVDELSMGLAPVICQRLVELLHSLSREDGVGILLVEQHVSLALEAADRGYVMRRGEISLEGSAAYLNQNLDAVKAAYLGEQASVQTRATVSTNSAEAAETNRSRA